MTGARKLASIAADDSGAGGCGRFPGFKILRQVGVGATSLVYLATDLATGKPVALKTLYLRDVRDKIDVRRSVLTLMERGERGNHGEPGIRLGTQVGSRERAALRMLTKEMEIAKSISHEGILRVHGGHIDHETPSRSWLAMDYMAGGTLEKHCAPRAGERARPEGRAPLLSLERLITIYLRIARALAYAESHGIIHCDLKPANLLVSGGDPTQVVVADFGGSHGRDTRLAQAGSLAYMSPEQLQNRPTDARSDMFSLAATFYHLLTGDPPFPAATQRSMIYRILHEEPDATIRVPLVEADGVPQQLPLAGHPLWPLLERCLRKSPEERLPSWASLIEHLECLHADATASATHEDRTSELRKVLQTQGLSPPLIEHLAGLVSRPSAGAGRRTPSQEQASLQRVPSGYLLYDEGQPAAGLHLILQGQVGLQRRGRLVELMGVGVPAGGAELLAQRTSHGTAAVTRGPARIASFPQGVVMPADAVLRAEFIEWLSRHVARQQCTAWELLA